MPLLFFALASASSEQASHDPCASLALHPGSNGWQSARFCTYPQELLLELERGAEIREIEITARSHFAPGSVEVFLSSKNGFERVATLDMQGGSARGTKKVRQKMFALCSGQVKLLIHEPTVVGSSNPYKQVSLSSVDLWGHEDALPKKAMSSTLTVDLGEQHDEIAAVLMELGVPLSMVPVDEDSSGLAAADVGTKLLVQELRAKEDGLLRRSEFGQAQQLEEDVQELYGIGQELRKLYEKRDELLQRRARAELRSLSQRIADLEERRLHLAAFHETDWWLSKMALPAAVLPADDEPKELLDLTKKILPSMATELHETPKSARNSMPSGFGRSQFADAPLSTARSQP